VINYELLQMFPTSPNVYSGASKAELVLGLVQRFGVPALLDQASTQLDGCWGVTEGTGELNGISLTISCPVVWFSSIPGYCPVAGLYSSQSLANSLQHCRLARESSAQKEHWILSTALLLKLLQKKGLLDQQTEQILLIAGVVEHLLASLTCNTHGIGQMEVISSPANILLLLLLPLLLLLLLLLFLVLVPVLLLLLLLRLKFQLALITLKFSSLG
jgi:hypothetical protein